MNIKKGISESFRYGTAVTKLIYINLAVFLLVNIAYIVCRLMDFDDHFVLQYTALPADFGQLLYRPWTLVSYMFVHKGFLHVLFNVLNLYWFGRLFLMYFSQKQLTGLYLLGGLSGGVFYMLMYNIFPYFQGVLHSSLLFGASASMLAVMMGVAAYAPEMRLQMLFIGEVRLKFIAAFVFFLSLLSVVGENAGGNIAHLGGLAMGFFFALQFKKGKDITRGLNRVVDWVVDFATNLFRRKPKMKVVRGGRPMNDHDWNAHKKQQTQELDAILDKIKQSGYDKLSAEEKQKLFEHSGK
ncbi:MAG: rhomboid family intramembrane serine protease [Prevotellaceae bacterium]|jgi:membrane associated rhomboid family serine protease|nr:rhomboid family intramembrane serine protease [Prevotellaceae bacterium]